MNRGPLAHPGPSSSNKIKTHTSPTQGRHLVGNPIINNKGLEPDCLVTTQLDPRVHSLKQKQGMRFRSMVIHPHLHAIILSDTLLPPFGQEGQDPPRPNLYCSSRILHTDSQQWRIFHFSTAKIQILEAKSAHPVFVCTLGQLALPPTLSLLETHNTDSSPTHFAQSCLPSSLSYTSSNSSMWRAL